MDVSVIIVFVGLIVFLAHLFAVLFERTRIPDVLPLIFIGLLFGPILNIVTPAAFGRVGSVFTTVALVVILFESGLGLNFATLRKSMLSGSKLTIISFVITLFVVMGTAKLLIGLSWMEAGMLGAILGGTSSAVVIPLVNRLSINTKTRTILILESSFSDVLCIVVTLGILQAVKFQTLNPGKMMGQMIAAFILAGGMGAVASYFWSRILSRVRQLETNAFTTVAFVFIVYGISELLGYSGAIAALAFGIILGNIQSVKLKAFEKWSILQGGNGDTNGSSRLTRSERNFFAELVFLIKTFFFVYIGLLIHLSNLKLILIGLLITILIYIFRIPSVFVSLERKLSQFDATVAAVMVPKGLAAAVLASLAVQEGLERGTTIQDTVYAVVLVSIVLTSVLVVLIEKNVVNQYYDIAFRGFAESKAGADSKSDAKDDD